MAENDTLLAHLVTKRHIRQVEDAATDALAQILNDSKIAKSAFKTFLETTISRELRDCIYFSTQKTEGYSRFDLVGYDSGLNKRVIGESKFDAALGRGQGGGYLQQLAVGPSVLLFVVPDYRIGHLWKEVRNDVQTWEIPGNLGPTTTNRRIRVAEDEKGRCLMMVSWGELLDVIEKQIGDNEEGVKSNLYQLRGLTELMDQKAFLPLEEGELGVDIPRRLRDLKRLVDDVISAGIRDVWLSVEGFRATPRYDGYVRYFRLEGSDVDAWFGIYYEHWARTPGTPLWFGLQLSSHNRQVGQERIEKVRAVLHREWLPESDGSIPIRLEIGEDYEEVLLPNVVSQLKRIADAIREATK